MDRFPNRMTFANAVLEAIVHATPKVIITYWSCSKEKHIDGSPHYHFAVNFSGPNRWEPIKLYLEDTYGILAHFSVKHLGYNAAYKYIIKSDGCYLTSDDHSNLDTMKVPKTKRGMKGNALKRQNKSAVTSTPVKKSTKTVRKRLSKEGVAQFMINNNIRTEAELMTEAKKKEQASEPELWSLIITEPKRTLQELIEQTWAMHEAPESVARDKLSRMQVIQKTLETECIEGCSVTWLRHARVVLRQNHINVYVFGIAIRKLLTVGRQNNANILLRHHTYCGKSYLLNPLEFIYKTFCNSATG